MNDFSLTVSHNMVDAVPVGLCCSTLQAGKLFGHSHEIS